MILLAQALDRFIGYGRCEKGMDPVPKKDLGRQGVDIHDLGDGHL